MLALYEELFLLSVHEEKGSVIASAAECLPAGLVGALLCELALMGKIKVKEKQRLELLDGEPTGDEYLDEALNSIRADEQERKISHWINTLALRPKKSYKHIIEQLAQKGVVTQDDERLNWAIPSPLRPDLQASAKYVLKTRQRAILLANAQAELRELAILSLLKACDLLDLVVTRDERKLASNRIHELVLGEAIKNPIAQTIEEIQDAVAAHADQD